MELALGEFARRTLDRVIYATTPRSIALSLGPVVTRDGHQLSLQCNLTASLVDREADVVFFNEQLLQDRPVVTLDTVRQYVAPALSTSLSEFAQQHDAAACLAQRTTVSELILQRANDIGFACGLEFLPPLEAVLRCPTLEAERAAGQVARQQTAEAENAVELLRILNSAGPNTLADQQQIALLPTLFRQQSAGTVMVVAGNQVLEYAPAEDRWSPQTMPTSIGLLRSVSVSHVGERSIAFAGGQRGIASIGSDQNVFLAVSSSERGFNAIAADAASRQVVAAHGELGLVRWSLDDGQSLAPVAVNGSPRNLTAIDERLVFSVDNQLMSLDGATVHPVLAADDVILKIVVIGSALVVVCRNGTVERLDRTTFAPVSRFSRRVTLTAAAGVELSGLPLLLLAGESGPVVGVAIDGTPRSEWHSAHTGLRMLAVTGRYILGVSSDRQHLLTWDGASTGRPLRTANVVAQTGHRISDLVAL